MTSFIMILFVSPSGTKMIALKGFEEGQKPDFLVGNLSCMDDVPLFDKIKDRCEKTQLLMFFALFEHLDQCWVDHRHTATMTQTPMHG